MAATDGSRPATGGARTGANEAPSRRAAVHPDRLAASLAGRRQAEGIHPSRDRVNARATHLQLATDLFPLGRELGIRGRGRCGGGRTVTRRACIHVGPERSTRDGRGDLGRRGIGQRRPASSSCRGSHLAGRARACDRLTRGRRHRGRSCRRRHGIGRRSHRFGSRRRGSAPRRFRRGGALLRRRCRGIDIVVSAVARVPERPCRGDPDRGAGGEDQQTAQEQQRAKAPARSAFRSAETVREARRPALRSCGAQVCSMIPA